MSDALYRIAVCRGCYLASLVVTLCVSRIDTTPGVTVEAAFILLTFPFLTYCSVAGTATERRESSEPERPLKEALKLAIVLGGLAQIISTVVMFGFDRIVGSGVTGLIGIVEFVYYGIQLLIIITVYYLLHEICTGVSPV